MRGVNPSYRRVDLGATRLRPYTRPGAASTPAGRRGLARGGRRRRAAAHERDVHDSSILGALIRASETADGLGKEGVAVVAPPSSAAARLFDLVGAEDMLAVFPSREPALATYTELPRV